MCINFNVLHLCAILSLSRTLSYTHTQAYTDRHACMYADVYMHAHTHAYVHAYMYIFFAFLWLWLFFIIYILLRCVPLSIHIFINFCTSYNSNRHAYSECVSCTYTLADFDSNLNLIKIHGANFFPATNCRFLCVSSRPNVATECWQAPHSVKRCIRWTAVRASHVCCSHYSNRNGNRNKNNNKKLIGIVEMYGRISYKHLHIYLFAIFK